MSEKNLDSRNRWRSKTIAFRVSPEENKLLETFVKLSGMTKQSYLTSRMLKDDIVVQGNPRVFKALKSQLTDVYEELRRIEAGEKIDEDLLRTISMIAVILSGFKETN